MATETRARCDKGSACSNAFVFDDTGRHRHAVVTVHSDGSGAISIYDSKRQRLLSKITLTDFRQFRVIREAIDSQTAAADIARLKLAAS